MSTPLTIMIDWLEFTVKNVELEILITEVLKLPIDDFTELPKGRFGYSTQLRWVGGDLVILYNTFIDDEGESVETVADPMGIHVLITGKGCRFYEAVTSLTSLIKKLDEMKIINKVTRIDLALDDVEGEFISYERVQAAVINGDFTSRWSQWREVTERLTKDNSYTGRTLYLGSPSSELFCRVYDKTLERRSNDPNADIPEHWTRLEAVYHKERANQLAKHIRGGSDVGQLLRQTLNQYVRFLVHQEDDTNKARWESVDWWDHLIGQVGTLQLTVKKASKSIEEMEGWVAQQIGPSLATLMKAHGGEMKWFVNVLYAGEVRMKQKHRDAIAQYAG